MISHVAIRSATPDDVAADGASESVRALLVSAAHGDPYYVMPRTLPGREDPSR